MDIAVILEKFTSSKNDNFDPLWGQNPWREQRPRVDVFSNLIFAIKWAMIEVEKQTKNAFQWFWGQGIHF